MDILIYIKEKYLLLKTNKLYLEKVDYDTYCSVGLYSEDHTLIKEYNSFVEGNKELEEILKYVENKKIYKI